MIGFDNFIHSIYHSVLSANDALAQKNTELLQLYFEESEDKTQPGSKGSPGDFSKLKPKTVTIQYPNVTAKGVEVHDVQVPIIAIAPVSMSKISEVKVTTTLELSLEDDALMISFPSKKQEDNKDEPTPNCGFSTIEITLNPMTPPDGLRKIIEGYEKALRAQIPG
ncbi:MAG: DUF2589 domain-containing protein [Saprospiraceae bacterium]|nr:DUF2589 domain-containing protein [Saprospiraceae bacterium]